MSDSTIAARKGIDVSHSGRPPQWNAMTAYPDLRPDFVERHPGMVGACRMFGCKTPLCQVPCQRQ